MAARPSRHPALQKGAKPSKKRGGVGKYLLPAAVGGVILWLLWPEGEAEAAKPAKRPGKFRVGQRVKTTAPSNLRVRTEPSETSAAVTPPGQGLPLGTQATVTAIGFPPTGGAPLGWTRIRTGDGREGFVSSEWIADAAEPIVAVDIGPAQIETGALLPRMPQVAWPESGIGQLTPRSRSTAQAAPLVSEVAREPGHVYVPRSPILLQYDKLVEIAVNDRANANTVTMNLLVPQLFRRAFPNEARHLRELSAAIQAERAQAVTDRAPGGDPLQSPPRQPQWPFVRVQPRYPHYPIVEFFSTEQMRQVQRIIRGQTFPVISIRPSVSFLSDGDVVRVLRTAPDYVGQEWFPTYWYVRAFDGREGWAPQKVLGST